MRRRLTGTLTRRAAPGARFGWLQATAAALALILMLPLLAPPWEPVDVVSNFWPHLALPLLVFTILAVRRHPALAAFCGLTSLIVLGVCLRSLNSAAQGEPAPAGGTPLKVISFNVLNDNRAGAAEVRDFLLAQNADFVFLQEARGVVRALGGPEAAQRQLGSLYPYRSGCEAASRCSTLLLSKHPLRSVRRPDVSPGSHRFVIAEADVGGRALTLVGVHLTRPLEDGVQQRQLPAVGDTIRDLPRPLVLAGDFNAAPWSTTMRELLARAGLAYSYGYNPTWPVWAPGIGLPIDHIVADGLSVAGVEVGRDPIGSNHLPLIVQLSLP